MVANQIDVKKFNFIQNYIITPGFAIFNLVLAFSLFHTFAENAILKWVYSGAGILWDASLLVNLVLLKTSIKHRKTGGIVGYSASYVVLLLVGIIGAVGFNVASVKHQSEVVNNLTGTITVAQDTINSNKTSIHSHESTIAAYQKSIKVLSENLEKQIEGKTAGEIDWLAGLNTTKIEKINTSIKAENSEVDRLKKENDEQQKIVSVKSVNISGDPLDTGIAADDIFKAVADILGIKDSSYIRTFVFLLFIIMIHSVLFVNAPVLNTKTKVDTVNRRSVEQFIDALFDVPGARLATDDLIITKTGLSEKEVKDIRKFILELPSWKGQPVMIQGRGIGTKCNVNKDTLKTLVRVNLESGE